MHYRFTIYRVPDKLPRSTDTLSRYMLKINDTGGKISCKLYDEWYFGMLRYKIKLRKNNL